MEVQPAAVIKRPATCTNFNVCVICQKSKTEKLRKASSDGKIKLQGSLQKRRKLRDHDNIMLLDRLDAVSAEDWESDTIQWHKSCYSTFTSEQRLDRLKKKLEESASFSRQAEETAEEEIAEPSGASRRCSVEAVNWNKCMFCQGERKSSFHSVETFELSDKILRYSVHDPVIRVRLSGVSDLIAAEGKYHLACLAKFERQCKNLSESGRDIKDSTFETLCGILEGGLARGHVYDMGNVWNKYLEIHSSLGVSEVPQKYLTRRQTFHEDIKKMLGGQASFVRPLDPRASLLMYPGEKSEYVISKTLTKACNRKGEYSVEDTESSEGSSEEEDLLTITDSPDIRIVQDMVHVALKLRSDLKETPGHSGVWTGIDQDHVERIIPDSLYMFLRLLFGGISLLEEDGDEVSRAEKRKICSIAQDIVYGVSNNTKLTPKHIGLGLALHQATRSENLVNLFHSANHTIGIDTIRRIDNCIASSVLDKYVENGFVYIPDNILPGPMVQFSCDNIDVLEATLDGKNTFHSTTMMAWQRGTQQRNESSEYEPDLDRNRTLDSKLLDRIHSLDNAKVVAKRPSPVFKEGTVIDVESWFKRIEMQKALYKNLLWIVARQYSMEDQKIPLWGGFNEACCSMNPPVTTAGMLPILQAPADNDDTMTTVMNRFVSITRQVGQRYTVITADQPLYSRGKELIWSNPDQYQNVILCMGGLHICFNFLKAIGQQVENAGLDDVWIETGLFAPNTTETVLDGKAYYRAVRGHIITYEAIWRIRWRLFQDWLIGKESDALEGLETVVRPVLESFALKKRGFRQDVHENVEGLDSFIQDKKYPDMFVEFDRDMSRNKNYVFWVKYLEMVEVLLAFIRAQREGNWGLHLESFAAMLPWLTIYDHTNYARWGPVYLTEMNSLQYTAPEIYNEFQNGNFVVKRSNNHFNQVPVDQATEWVNRMFKTAGGIIGITRSDQARDRFCVTWSVRSQVSHDTKVLFDLEDDGEETTFTRNDAQPSRIEGDEKKVKELMQQFVSLGVFGDLRDLRLPAAEIQTGEEAEGTTLVSLATKDVAFDEISQDLLTAEERGRQCVKHNVEQRLKEMSTPFFDPIKKYRSRTFATLYRPLKAESSKTEKKIIKADRKLLQRLFNAANAGRSVQIEEVLRHELSPVPLSLAKPTGVMNTTTKSQILSALTTDLGIDTPHDIPESSLPTCVLIDGHALIQTLQKPAGCTTFGDYSSVFTEAVFKHIRGSTTRVDVLFDRYLGAQSIKSTTRSKRVGKKRPIRKLIEGPDVPLPQVWSQYIALEDNKADLAFVLSNEILEGAESLPQGCEVVAGGGFEDPHNTKSNKRDVSHLEANHEEADTRLILHAKDACEAGHRRILVLCSDTDVMLLLLYHVSDKGAQVWMLSGTSKKRKCYPVHKIASKLSETVKRNILGFHALTGCDTTSSFSGIGKRTCWKKYLEVPDLLEAVGRDGVIDGVQRFVCLLYTASDSSLDVTTTDHMRYIQFSKAKSLELLPPTSDALGLHFKRSNYQAKLWLQADKTVICVETPSDSGGWRSGAEGLELIWTTLAAVPDACIELTTCACKTKCNTTRCKCYKMDLVCTKACGCDAIDCANPKGLQAASVE